MIRPIDDAEILVPDLPKVVASIFSAKGLLSTTEGFEFREQQQQMAVAAARSLSGSRHLAVEAGTGVGKSYGYLIPAVLHALAHRRRIIVSTHTINLQEQLLEKDIPFVQGVLKKLSDQTFLEHQRANAAPQAERDAPVSDADLLSFRAVLVKGRANYLCPHRLERALRDAKSLFVGPEQTELRRIADWARHTKDGTLSDLEIQPDPKVWAEVCSERGICTPRICEADGKLCFFQQARRLMRTADLLVVNHHLLFTELGIRDDIEGEEDKGDTAGVLLPHFDCVILDEAHTMEATAAEHIGIGVTLAGMRWWLHRLWNPKTKKGLLASLRQGHLVTEVDGLLMLTDGFFGTVEELALPDPIEPLNLRTGSRVGHGDCAAGPRHIVGQRTPVRVAQIVRHLHAIELLRHGREH